MRNYSKLGLRTGQIISIPLLIPPFRHKGVVSDRIGNDGFPTVISASYRAGRVVEEEFTKFAQCREIRVEPTKSCFMPLQVVLNARKILGKEYDLFYFNCDHFVSLVTTGEARSVQLDAIFLFGLSALVLVGIVTNSKGR